MKTADEILTEVMNDSPYNANFSLSRPYIIEAMKMYAVQKQTIPCICTKKNSWWNKIHADENCKYCDGIIEYDR